MLLPWLLFLSCAPPEQKCLLARSTPVTEGEATEMVERGMVLVSNSVECQVACVRDATVTPGEPSGAAWGYCAQPCNPAAGQRECAEGTSCAEVDERRLCLRTPG